MIVSVSTDFSRFRATLDELGRRQLPFAASLVLTQTARTASGDLTRALPAIFSAKGTPPTPFTMRAIGMTPARKNNLWAEIFVKRDQARYLGLEETGGERTAAPGMPLLTPGRYAGSEVANQYGNLPRGLVRRLLSDPENYFLGTLHGQYGLWERTYRGGERWLRQGRGVRLLVAFHKREGYRPRFGFQDHIAGTVGAVFLPNLSAGLARAIATAIRR